MSGFDAMVERPSEWRRIQALQESEPGRSSGQLRPARVLSVGLVLGVTISLLSVRGSSPALAEDPPGDAESQVDPAAEAGDVQGASARLNTTAWGQQSHGLQCRVKAPIEIEQGMRLKVTVELRSNPEKLDPQVKQLNTLLPAAFLELSLSDRRTGKSFTVRPRDPTWGMPVLDSGEYTAPLDGTPLKAWHVAFPLARLYETLEPGSYECRVQYSFPRTPTRFWHRKPEEWQAAGFWHGTVLSAGFDLKVNPETPKTSTLLLPRRLRVEKELVQLRDDDVKKTAVPVIRFRSEDAEEVTVPVRNGHLVAAQYYRDGQFYMLTAPPKPDDVNHIDTWYDYKGGDKKASYTIEVFETRDPAAGDHGWLPNPHAHGYKVLWKKSFVVSVREQEFRKLPESAPGNAAGAAEDRRPSSDGLGVELRPWPEKESIYNRNPVTVRFANRGKRRVTVFKPLDGSLWSWHMPYYRLTVLDAEGGQLKLPLRCGVSGLWANTKWPDDYVVQLDPGKSYELEVGIHHSIPEDGKYRVRFEYVYDPDVKQRQRYPVPEGAWIGRVRSEEIELSLRKSLY